MPLATTRRVEFDAGGPQTLEWRIPPGRSLEGVVLDAEGQVVAGAMIWLSRSGVTQTIDVRDVDAVHRTGAVVSETWADDWVRDVVLWQKEYGEELAVIFSELMPNSDETVESIALRKKWLGSWAIWMHEYLVDIGM
ncbi:MAG: hypothetical protein ACI841_000778 [Planctomycetota bacterium]